MKQRNSQKQDLGWMDHSYSRKDLGTVVKKQTSKILISDFPKLKSIANGEIEKVGAQVAEDLVGPSTKTLVKGFPLHDYAKPMVFDVVSTGGGDLVELNDKYSFTLAISDQLKSIKDEIKPAIANEVRKAIGKTYQDKWN